MSTLITNVSSFVGFHLCRKLLSKGENVIGLYDDLERIDLLKHGANAHHLTLIKVALTDAEKLQQIVNRYCPSRVFHFSDFENNAALAANTLLASMNVLEACAHASVAHCLLSSSSAVYLPHQYSAMAPNELTEHPQHLVAATVRANELLCHSYSFNYNLPCTIVRFFELYGSHAAKTNLVQQLWEKVHQHDTLDLSQYPSALLDFTYIDDACNALLRLQEHPAKPNPDWELDEECMDSSTAPWRIYNVGTGLGTRVFTLLETIAEVQGQPLHLLERSPLHNPKYQQVADVTTLVRETGYQPRTNLADGLRLMLTDV